MIGKIRKESGEMKRIVAMLAVFLLIGLSTVQAGPHSDGLFLAAGIVNLVGASAQTLRILGSPSVVVVPAEPVVVAPAPAVVTPAPVVYAPAPVVVPVAPVVMAPAPVVYAPAPVYYYGPPRYRYYGPSPRDYHGGPGGYPHGGPDRPRH
ncbi:hypothetical protein SDC9_150291 [bioreactor metagenome]|uniref:Uncharacterized protein n=1 Tax=bioreactor metagenome TaxID=1076179 RepID=A0A645EM20_9ZZZZ